MKPARVTAAVVLATALAAAPAATGATGAGQPPETTITSGPSGITDDPAPSFRFSSDQPGSSFECRLDGASFAERFQTARGVGGSWTPGGLHPAATPAHSFDPRWESCTSPKSYRHVVDGSHTFEVRATNQAGEIDPSPASRSFVVETSVRGEAPARAPQKQSRGTVRVKVRIEAEEDLVIRARGDITLRRASARGRTRLELRPRTVQVAGGESRMVRLRPQRRSDEKRSSRALWRGRKVKAKLVVELTNASGNSATRRLDVGLKPRKARARTRV